MKVFQRIVSLEAHSVHLNSLTFTVFLVVKRTVDFLLFDRYKVQFWAMKTSMLCLAILAVVYFELINNMLRLVSKEA